MDRMAALEASCGPCEAFGMGEDRDPEAASSREELPWPFSELDNSPAASRRRGIRLFHVVVLVLAGGVAVSAGALLAAAVVCGVVIAVVARTRYPDLVAAVNRLGTETTEVYAKIEQANREIEDARQARAANQDGPSPS